MQDAEKVASVFFGWATLVISIATPIFAALCDHSSWLRGSSPPKRVTVTTPFFTDVLKDVQIAGGAKLTTNGEQLSSLFQGSVTLANRGQVAILPSDVFEPIAVEVSEGWRLIAVDSSSGSKIKFQWLRVSDRCFSATPALLNPGDELSVRVYAAPSEADRGLLGQPSLAWRARIASLSSIEVEPRPDFSWLFRQPSTAWVLLAGWKLIFLLIAGPTLHAFYLYYGWHLRLWTGVDSDSVFRIVGLGLLAFAAAESYGSVLFPTVVDMLGSRLNWLNVVMMSLHIGVLMCMIVAVHRRGRRGRSEHAGLEADGGEAGVMAEVMSSRDRPRRKARRRPDLRGGADQID
jgi:hypothetical protein